MTPEEFKSKTVITDAEGQLGVIINQSRLLELQRAEERLKFMDAAMEMDNADMFTLAVYGSFFTCLGIGITLSVHFFWGLEWLGV